MKNYDYEHKAMARLVDEGYNLSNELWETHTLLLRIVYQNLEQPSQEHLEDILYNAVITHQELTKTNDLPDKEVQHSVLNALQSYWNEK